MSTREITSEQFDRYVAMRAEVDTLRDRMRAATTLAEKLAISRERDRLVAAMRAAVDA